MVVGPNQPISLSNLCSNILYLFDLQLLKKKVLKFPMMIVFLFQFYQIWLYMFICPFNWDCEFRIVIPSWQIVSLSLLK